MLAPHEIDRIREQSARLDRPLPRARRYLRKMRIKVEHAVFDEWYATKSTDLSRAPLYFRWPRPLRVFAPIVARVVAQTSPFYSKRHVKIEGLNRHGWAATC